MPVCKSSNMLKVSGITVGRRKINMAVRAGQRHIYVRCVMYGSVMAGQTSRIRRASRIPASLLHMAGGALLFENGVSLAQSPARINSVVPPHKEPANPREHHPHVNQRQ